MTRQPAPSEGLTYADLRRNRDAAQVPIRQPAPSEDTKRCRRHDWVQNDNWNGGQSGSPIWQCVRCNATRDEAIVRRNRNNRARARQHAPSEGLREAARTAVERYFDAEDPDDNAATLVAMKSLRDALARLEATDAP